MIKLIHGDCFDYFSTIQDQSIDLVLCDPPYGTTACKWDSVLPLDEMWKNLERIVKPKAAIVLFSAQPFTSVLISSKLNLFKYEWIWHKTKPSGFLNAKKMPLVIHENICIFNATNYYPVMQELTESGKKRNKRNNNTESFTNKQSVYGKVSNVIKYKDKEIGYPKSIITFSKEANNQYKKQVFHPTQKPVELLEYLIKTYSLEGQTVLDFTMGSGSTGVACKNTNRNFIGIEKELEYYNIAKQRILTEGNEQVTEDWFDSFLEG